MIFILVGCTSYIPFYDVVLGKHITLSREAVKIAYYDSLEIIIRMNHNRRDFMIITWNRANYLEKTKEGWVVYLVKSKNEYYDIIDRFGLKIDRRSKK